MFPVYRLILNILNLLRSYVAPLKVSDAVRQQVKDLIKDNEVMIFSKSYSPFCKSTKKLLEKKGKAYKAIELDLDTKGWEIQQAVYEYSGYWKVPNTFINGKHIGGNDTIQALNKQGKLPF